MFRQDCGWSVPLPTEPVTMATESLDMYGTSLQCDVLTAYRRDLERTPDVVRFGEDDERWLRFALEVERLSGAVPARMRRTHPLGASPYLRPKRLLALTEAMEAAGALTLAFTTLAAARLIWDRRDPASAGTAIFHQARICRTAGAAQAAENFYAFLYSFATQHRLAELRGRALIGRGILRMQNGDRAGALNWYGRARTASGHHLVVVGVSSHAEMFVALAEDDSSEAMVAGYRALATRALPSWDEAGVLVNLATVSLRAGRPLAALHLLRRAASRTRQPRIRMAVHAKGALAAAALGKPTMVDRFAARLVATAAAVNLPYEELEARSDVAEAFVRVGEVAKGRRLARAIRREAERHVFAAITARCDRLLAQGATEEPPVLLSAPARRVVAQLQMA
jgi:hypothetical protein